jgi:pyruvate formate lyase activating enzyme
MAEAEGRILRICWETNGYWKREFAIEAARLSHVSGGNTKFDLKTWDENLNLALTGVTNSPTLETFKLIGEKFFKQRSELPILTASTLLVPGYVNAEEVGSIARFIAAVDTEIPYTLLAFYPQYVMTDLSTTSRKQANECYEAAKKHLENVRIGNIHLVGH